MMPAPLLTRAPAVSNAAPAILVVDDTPANLLAFTAILEPLGYPVVQAHDGDEALRVLLQRPIVLLLLDVQMPGMNGFELAALLHTHARLSSIPIIFITAISREAANVFTGYAHGAVDYLLKPVEPQVLRAKVNVFLELHRRQEKIREQAEQLHAHEVREIERRNQERFRDLTESMPLPVWGIQPDGQIYVCNRAWTEYSGQSALETEALTSARVVHPDDRERMLLEWGRGMAEGAAFDVECRLLRACDRAYRWHLLRAVPERAIERSGFWIVAGFDVEAQKASERARARLLEHEQRAREAAEAANRMKDDFLATVSHELRTPLNAILGWASMIRTGAVDPARLSRAIETIERSARTQARLVQDILDVSRIVTGKLRLHVTALDLASVVSEAVETVRPAADAKGIELVWASPPDSVRMSGDPARLQQIVWNLLSNAIKFTPKAGRVEVALEVRGDEARIRVVDNGPGIAPDFIPYVFDRFRQADSTSTRTHEGLGLGLSIVKSLAELHGGHVEVESPGAGKGAVFRVTLPLAALAETPAAAKVDVVRPPPAGEQTAGASPRLEGASVLFVDDHPEAREIVQQVLVHHGAKVSVVESAEQALRAIAESPPDVLISDIGLPDEDGYALLRRVRALGGAAAHLHAIALTAFAGNDDRRRSEAAGYQVHLSKPVEPDELIALVASLVPSVSGEASAADDEERARRSSEVMKAARSSLGWAAGHGGS